MNEPIAIERATLAGIAGAIRARRGTSDTYAPGQMAAAILGIPQGGDETEVSPLSVTANGSYTAPAGTAYSPVTVDVAPAVQSKTVTVTENGSVTVTPDAGYDGLSGVTVTADVAPAVQSKTVTVTENGSVSVTPDQGYDGLSGVTVTVNVAGGYRIHVTADSSSVVTATRNGVTYSPEAEGNGSFVLTVPAIGDYTVTAVQGGESKTATVTVQDAQLSLNVLPAAYTLLQYIQSTGTQYINPNLALGSGFRLVARVRFTELPHDATILGDNNTNGGVYNHVGVCAGGTRWVVGADSWNTNQEVIVNPDTEYQVDASTFASYSLTVNGSTVLSGTDTGAARSSQPYFFGVRYSGAAAHYAIMRLYGPVKVYAAAGAASPVATFWPARRDADGVLGLYDTVRRQFYANAAATGDDFVAGPTA